MFSSSELQKNEANCKTILLNGSYQHVIITCPKMKMGGFGFL